MSPFGEKTLGINNSVFTTGIGVGVGGGGGTEEKQLPGKQVESVIVNFHKSLKFPYPPNSQKFPELSMKPQDPPLSGTSFVADITPSVP